MVYADEQLYGSEATITNAVQNICRIRVNQCSAARMQTFRYVHRIPIGLVIDSGAWLWSSRCLAAGRLQEGWRGCPRPPDYGHLRERQERQCTTYPTSTRRASTAGAYQLDHNYDTRRTLHKGTSTSRADDTPVKVNGSVKLKVVNKGTGSSPITITKNQMVLYQVGRRKMCPRGWISRLARSYAVHRQNAQQLSDVQYAVGGKPMDNSAITTDGIDAGPDPQSTQRSRCEGGRHAVLYEIDGNQPSWPGIGLTAAELGQELKELAVSGRYSVRPAAAPPQMAFATPARVPQH